MSFSDTIVFELGLAESCAPSVQKIVSKPRTLWSIIRKFDQDCVYGFLQRMMDSERLVFAIAELEFFQLDHLSNSLRLSINQTSLFKGEASKRFIETLVMVMIKLFDRFGGHTRDLDATYGQLIKHF